MSSRPLPRRFFLAGSLAGSLVGLAACGTAELQPNRKRRVRLAPGTRLIMVRHGDRTDDNLSAKGLERARALPAALEGFPLDVIYSPGIQRNLDTAKPLAAARDMAITRIPQERPAPIIARRSPGQSVIWVGNKGNLRSIWSDLRLDGEPPLEYGDLFIVSADDRGALTVDRRRWGPE